MTSNHGYLSINLKAKLMAVMECVRVYVYARVHKHFLQDNRFNGTNEGRKRSYTMPFTACMCVQSFRNTPTPECDCESEKNGFVVMKRLIFKSLQSFFTPLVQ